MVGMTYAEKLQDPRWLLLRNMAIDLAERSCSDCDAHQSETTIQVHHKFYISGRNPWDYEIGDLRVLCRRCHEEHERVRVEVLRLFESFTWMESESFISEFREAGERVESPEALLRYLRMECSNMASKGEDA